MRPGNPYEILGIEAHASQEEIRKAYRSLVKKYHPDKNKTEGAAATFLAIQEAYEQICSGQAPTPEAVSQKQQRNQEAYSADLEAYRIKREANREKLRQKQQQEEAYRMAYLKQLKSGTNGIWHRTVAYFGLILTLVLWIDYFLPTHEKELVVKTYGIRTYGSVDGHAVQLLESTDGRFFWVADCYSQQLTKVQGLRSLQTPWLHQTKALAFHQGRYYKSVPVHFSFYWAQFWLSLLLILPYLSWHWASADIIFVAGSFISRYLVLALILFFLIRENRFIHLFSFGTL